MDILKKTVKKNFIVQVIQTIFIAILLLIATFQLNGDIVTEKRLMAPYIISIVAFFLIIAIVGCIYAVKIGMKPVGEEIDVYHIQNKIAFNLMYIGIGLIILGIICGLIDHRIDRIRFSKNCEKTEVYIYEIEKNASKIIENSKSTYQKESQKEYHYDVYYKYKFWYEVDEEVYYDCFSETKKAINVRSESQAIKETDKEEKLYEIGDTDIIYYNTNDPSDWRKSLFYVSKTTIYALEFILAFYQLFCLIKTKKEYEETKLVS